MKNDIESLEDKLSQQDFSKEGNKEEIKNKLLLKLEKNNSNIEGDDNMKFTKGFKPKNIAAASLICIVGFSAAIYGADMVRKSLTIGDHAEFFLPEKDIDDSEVDYSGDLIENDIFVFDEEGNKLALSEIPATGGTFYNDDEGITITSSNAPFDNSAVTLFDTFDEVKPYLAFNLLVPTVLPEGFNIDEIYMYNNEDGNIAEEGKNYYLNYNLLNSEGHRIYVQVRLLNEETAFATGATHNAKEIDINGNTALLDESTLYVSIDEAMYMFIDTSRSLSSDELVEMAKSLK